MVLQKVPGDFLKEEILDRLARFLVFKNFQLSFSKSSSDRVHF